LMNVRDGDYDHAGALLAIAGSVQLLWLLIVLFVLPTERRVGRGSHPASADATGPADRRQVDQGSVPASALRTRVVLPPPSDGALRVSAPDQHGTQSLPIQRRSQ